MKKILAILALAAGALFAEAPTPAEAQIVVRTPGLVVVSPGYRPHRHVYRPRCHYERRAVRVMTPWGPRLRSTTVRVCR